MVSDKVKSILQQILLKGKNKWQIIGAALGAFLGLFMMLMSLQLYLDLQSLTSNGGTGDGTAQFVIVNKQVNLFNTLGVKSTFTTEEIENIKAKDFVESVGIFTSNQYKVSASSSMLGFYTELFFEAVADDFVDVQSSSFTWSSGQNDIPIILPRDYLALYNFGFAPSQGLPQFTPSTIKRVSMDITLRGNSMRKIFKGRIVGFSDRINSIIVPLNFMEYANKTFGNEPSKESSRLILAVSNPNSSEFASFLEKNNYEVSTGRLIGGELGTLLRSVISFIAIIGFIIVFLSILVFILNFQLIISQSSEDIRLLLQLGYKHSTISQLLIKYLTMLFVGILLLTFIALFIARFAMVKWFATQGFSLATNFNGLIYLAGLLLALSFYFINSRNIKKNVIGLFQ